MPDRVESSIISIDSKITDNITWRSLIYLEKVLDLEGTLEELQH